MIPSFHDSIEQLRQLIPINGIIHVGAGNGRDSDQYVKWTVPSVMLIEADEIYADQLATVLQSHPGWTSSTALVSDGDSDANFYLANNPNENGLLQPENLIEFWRNLKTREFRTIKSTTLDKLIGIINNSQLIFNYVVVDCLPALPILLGAKNSLVDWDVIIARVVLDESKLPDQGARKSELDDYLKPLGFRCILVEEENHPAIGQVVYVRDWKEFFSIQHSEYQLKIQQ